VPDWLSKLPAHERRRLLAADPHRAQELARRRLAGEPLQYLEGTAAFKDFDVLVDDRVLIPRPETEGLVELVTRLVEKPNTNVDLGTGSGVLAIALARRFPNARVHAVDISAPALEVAEANAERLGVSVEFHHGDLFDPLPPRLKGTVDLLVSNPPYVAEGEFADLPVDVKREPRLALLAGHDGTEILERIARQAGEWLASGGVVACEISEFQGDWARDAFSPLGPPEIRLDLAGRPRYVVVRSE